MLDLITNLITKKKQNMLYDFFLSLCQEVTD